MRALLPIVTLFIGKLIIDEVVRLVGMPEKLVALADLIVGPRRLDCDVFLFSNLCCQVHLYSTALQEASKGKQSVNLSLRILGADTPLRRSDQRSLSCS